MPRSYASCQAAEASTARCVATVATVGLDERRAYAPEERAVELFEAREMVAGSHMMAPEGWLHTPGAEDESAANAERK